LAFTGCWLNGGGGGGGCDGSGNTTCSAFAEDEDNDFSSPLLSSSISTISISRWITLSN